MTIGKLADDALQVQDACNPVAVANGFGRAITELWRALKENNPDASMDDVRGHAISLVWLSKISDMHGTCIDYNMMPVFETVEKLRAEYLAEKHKETMADLATKFAD